MSQQQPWWQRAAQWQLPWQIPTPETARGPLEFLGDTLIPGAATGRAMAEGNMGPGTMAMGALDFLPVGGLMGRGFRGVTGAANRMFSNMNFPGSIANIQTLNPLAGPGGAGFQFPNIMGDVRSGSGRYNIPLSDEYARQKAFGGYAFTDPYLMNNMHPLRSSQRMVVGAVPGSAIGGPSTPRLFATDRFGQNFRPMEMFRPDFYAPGGTSASPIRQPVGSPSGTPDWRKADEARMMSELNRRYTNLPTGSKFQVSGSSTPADMNRMIGIGNRPSGLPNTNRQTDIWQGMGDVGLAAAPAAVKMPGAAEGSGKRARDVRLKRDEDVRRATIGK